MNSFMKEFFTNFVHEFEHEIRTNSYEFLQEKLVMLRMACTVWISMSYQIMWKNIWLFTWETIFIDSFQFMSSSLHKLVSNLPNDAFKYTSEEIKNFKKLKLMKQKGVYPYDYLDSFNRFIENKLSNKDDFYSILIDKHISDTQYVDAINVWNLIHLNGRTP